MPTKTPNKVHVHVRSDKKQVDADKVTKKRKVKMPDKKFKFKNNKYKQIVNALKKLGK